MPEKRRSPNRNGVQFRETAVCLACGGIRLPEQLRCCEQCGDGPFCGDCLGDHRCRHRASESRTNDEDHELLRRSADADANTTAWTNPVPKEMRTMASGLFPTTTYDEDWSHTKAGKDFDAFMTRMRSRVGVAMLVDTGSPSNVCGSRWSAEMEGAALQHGRPERTWNRRKGKFNWNGF